MTFNLITNDFFFFFFFFEISIINEENISVTKAKTFLLNQNALYFKRFNSKVMVTMPI